MENIATDCITSKYKLTKSVINAISSEIRNVLSETYHLEESYLEKNDTLTKNEICTIFSNQQKIIEILRRFEKISQSNFKGANIKSDCTGIITNLSFKN